jgi:hypothetical protein
MKGVVTISGGRVLIGNIDALEFLKENVGREVELNVHNDDIERLLKRYSREQRDIIDAYWLVIKDTRKTGNVADSVIQKELEYWSRFPVNVVMKAIAIHIARYRGKKEDYTRGIMRRVNEEMSADGSNQKGKRSDDAAGYGRFAI